MMTDEQRLESLVTQKGWELCRQAVGRPFTIRTAKATRTSSGATSSGTIETAVVAGVRWTGRSCRAQFHVVLRQPDGQLSRTFTVERLPQ